MRTSNRKSQLVGLVLFVVLAVAIGAGTDTRIERMEEVFPAALGGHAFEISVKEGAPITVEVSTEFPVLRYGGRSSSGRFLAYTTLDALDENLPDNRRIVRSALTHEGDVLVPTGDLYVENTRSHTTRRVDLDDHYVVRSAWSPDNPNLLVYSFASPEGDFGLAIADLGASKVTTIRSEGVLADHLAWGPEGIEVYELDGFRAAADPGFEVEHFRPSTLDVDGGLLRMSTSSRSLPVATERLTGTQGFKLRIGGHTLRGEALAGSDSLELRSESDILAERFESPLIESHSSGGVVIKALDDVSGEEQLLFISIEGVVTSLVTASANSTNYYLPFMSGTTVKVTQSGTGYSPSCGIYDHSGSLKYAYDLQPPAGDSDAVLASAAGTIAYFKKSVTCNSLDGPNTGCSIYSSACTGSRSYHGWGNVVVIEHSDGRWTSYAHLRHGTVKPTSTGVAVQRGCKLGNMGGTGATIGIRNGCGDHLHWQRQNGSSMLSSSSVKLDLASLTNPLRCSRTYTAGATYRLCF